MQRKITQIYLKTPYLILIAPLVSSNSSDLTVDAYSCCFRACGSYHNFHDRGLLPANNEAIERRNLRSPSRYGISASQMTTDMFRLSSLQSDPVFITNLSSGF